LKIPEKSQFSAASYLKCIKFDIESQNLFIEKERWSLFWTLLITAFCFYYFILYFLVKTIIIIFVLYKSVSISVRWLILFRSVALVKVNMRVGGQFASGCCALIETKGANNKQPHVSHSHAPCSLIIHTTPLSHPLLSPPSDCMSAQNHPKSLFII